MADLAAQANLFRQQCHIQTLSLLNVQLNTQFVNRGLQSILELVLREKSICKTFDVYLALFSFIVIQFQKILQRSHF